MKRFLMPALIGVMVFFILCSISNAERVLVEDYRISTGSQEMIIMLDFNDKTSHTVILQDSIIENIRLVGDMVVLKYGKFVINRIEIVFIDNNIAQKFYNEILEKYIGEINER